MLDASANNTDPRKQFPHLKAEIGHYLESFRQYYEALAPDRCRAEDLALMKRLLKHLKFGEIALESMEPDGVSATLAEIQELEREIKPKPKVIRLKSNTITFQFETAIHRNAVEAYAYAVEKGLEAFVAGTLFVALPPNAAHTILTAGFGMDKLICHRNPMAITNSSVFRSAKVV